MSMENQPSAPQTLKPSSEEDGADNGNNKEWFEAYNFAREICAKQERIDLSRFPTLRAWLSLQGEELRKGRLSRERKILLDNIHKDWQQAHDVSVSVINSSKCDGKKSPQPLQQKPEELYNADIGEGKGKGLSSDCSDNALEKDLEQSGTTASVSVESSAVHVEEKHGDAPTTTSKSESISKTAVAPTTTSVQTAREEEEGPKPPPAATKTKTKTPTEAAAQDSEKATKNNKDTSTDADAEQVPVLPATTTRNSRNIPKDDKLQKAINKIVAAAAAAAVEEEETKRKQLNKDIRSSDAEHVSMLPTTTARNSRNALPTSSTPNNDKPKKAVNNIAAAAAAKQEEMKRKQSTKGSDQSGLSVNKLDLTADNDAPATVTTVAQEDATEKEGPKQRVVENTWTVEKTSSTVVHKKEELMPNQNDATLKANPSSVDSSKPPKEQRCGVIRDKDKHKDRYMRAAGNNAINATGNRNHNRDPPATGPTYWAPTGYPTMPPIPTYYQYPPNAAPGVFPNPYTMYSSSPPFPPTASRPMQRQAQDSNNNNNNNSYRASIAGPRRKNDQKTTTANISKDNPAMDKERSQKEKDASETANGNKERNATAATAEDISLIHVKRDQLNKYTEVATGAVVDEISESQDKAETSNCARSSQQHDSLQEPPLKRPSITHTTVHESTLCKESPAKVPIKPTIETSKPSSAPAGLLTPNSQASQVFSCTKRVSGSSDPEERSVGQSQSDKPADTQTEANGSLISGNALCNHKTAKGSGEDGDAYKTYKENACEEDTIWMQHFANLKSFHNVNGHCRIPFTDKDLRSLYYWCKLQRKEYAKGQGALKNEQIDLLNGLNFDWSRKRRRERNNEGQSKSQKLSATTETAFGSQQEQTSEGSVSNVLDTMDDDSDRINKGIDDTKILELSGKKEAEEMESPCRPWHDLEEAKVFIRCSARGVRWLENYDKLHTFFSKNGHLNVLATEDTSLKNWIGNQRNRLPRRGPKDIVANAKKELLNQLEFDWSGNHFTAPAEDDVVNGEGNEDDDEECCDPHSSAHRDGDEDQEEEDDEDEYMSLIKSSSGGIQWSKTYRKLKTFFSRNGHCEIPGSKDNKPLQDFIRHQRNRLLAKGPEDAVANAKKDLLNRLNFDWSIGQRQPAAVAEAEAKDEDLNEEGTGRMDSMAVTSCKTASRINGVEDSRSDHHESPEDSDADSNSDTQSESSVVDEHWMARYRDLKAFYKKYGRGKVRWSMEEYRSLYYWVHRQKTVPLPDSKKKLLDKLGFFENEICEVKGSSPKVNVHHDKKAKPNATSSVRSSPRKHLLVVDRNRSKRKADHHVARSMSFEDDDSDGTETASEGGGKIAREDILEAMHSANVESCVEIPCQDYETLENYQEVVQNQIDEKKQNLARLLEISSRIRHLLGKGNK